MPILLETGTGDLLLESSGKLLYENDNPGLTIGFVSASATLAFGSTVVNPNYIAFVSSSATIALNATELSAATPSKYYAFPNFAGVRFRGSNISNRPGDSANGDFGTPSSFYDVLYDWGTGNASDPWNNWIKPQIDAIATNGGNLVRFVFDATVVVGDSSHHGAAPWRGAITTGQLNTILDQIISYLATKGMYFYASCAEPRPLDVAGISMATIETYITAYVAKVSSYDNVIAVDVFPEWDGAGTFAGANLAAAISTAKAAMVKSLPVTCAMNGASAATGGAGLDPAGRSAFGTLQAAGADFFDVHIYYKFNVRHLDPIINNSWNLPVVCSETGINFNGVYASGSAQESSHPYSSENRRDMYSRIAGLGRLPQLQLAGNWCGAPQSSYDGNDWGMFNASFVARSEMVGQWATIPKAPFARGTPFVLDLTGTTTGANYSTVTGYAIQNGVIARTTNWGIASGVLYGKGPTFGSMEYYNGVAWPQAETESADYDLQFDALGSLATPSTDNHYTTWGIGLNSSADGAAYAVTYNQNQVNRTFDNYVQLHAISAAGVETTLGSWSLGVNSDPSHVYRIAVQFRGISPTVVTVTVTDITAPLAFGYNVFSGDSTAGLQVATRQPELFAPLGTAAYQNIQWAPYADPGPTIGTVPSATGSTGSIGLTWSAASGGTGTVTYSPQYAPADANGFPSSGWINGSATTGTSGTITGLSSGSYAVRIASVDSSLTPAATYSPWTSGVVPLQSTLAFTSGPAVLSFGSTAVDTIRITFASAPAVLAFGSTVVIPATDTLTFASGLPVFAFGVQNTPLAIADTLGFVSSTAAIGINVLQGNASTATLGFASATATPSFTAQNSDNLSASLFFVSAVSTFSFNAAVPLPNTLLEAIRTRILDASSMSAVGQEVYNRMTPAKSRIVFPTIVINMIDEPEPDIFTGGDYYAGWVETQVTVLDTDETEGTSLRDQCYKLFRPRADNLTFVDGTHSGTIPGRRWEWDQPGNGPNGLTVWAAGFRMRLWVTRTML